MINESIYKIKKTCTFIFFGGMLIYFSAACGKQTCSCLTITPPDITLTGPKTSVEKQIMGDYKEIEKNAWLVSSATGQEDFGLKASDKGYSRQNEAKVFRSIAILESNREKLRDYQLKGIIGENNKGYAEKVSAEFDKEEKAKLDIEDLIQIVNQARKSLFLSLQQEAKDLNLSLDAIGKIFASKYMDNAPLGSKVQQENGKWLVKK